MRYTLTAFQAELDINLQGIETEEISTPDRDEKLEDALLDYSKHKPKELIAEITGDGGSFYPIADASTGLAWATNSGSLFTDWQEGFSQTLEIEYPAAVIADDETPEYLHRYEWDDNYRDGDNNRWLWFVSATPGSSETFRAKYIAPYIFSGSPSGIDISPLGFRAVCNKAASLCCGLLAMRYGQSTRPTYDIESINYLTKAEEYRRNAGEFQEKYERLLGIPRLGRVRAGAKIRKLPVTSSLHRDRGTLFHDY